jgi:hypothetical protein
LARLLLPEFQVQALILSGDSGSNPERATCREILLVANDLKKNIRGVNAVMVLSNLSVGNTSTV